MAQNWAQTLIRPNARDGSIATQGIERTTSPRQVSPVEVYKFTSGAARFPPAKLHCRRPHRRPEPQGSFRKARPQLRERLQLRTSSGMVGTPRAGLEAPSLRLVPGPPVLVVPFAFSASATHTCASSNIEARVRAFDVASASFKQSQAVRRYSSAV